MIALPQTLAAWSDESLANTALRELDANNLLARLLQRGLQRGNIALLDNVSARVLRAHQHSDAYHLRLGVSYCSLITGCACSDDPTPLSELPEYVELDIHLTADAQASVTLCED